MGCYIRSGKDVSGSVDLYKIGNGKSLRRQERLKILVVKSGATFSSISGADADKENLDVGESAPK
jgi:hypothetical protein